jgi:hypothetical protein
MTNIVAALGFLGFVLLVGMLGVFPRDNPRRRTLTTLLILYCLVATGGAVTLRRDLWPFSSWSMMGRMAPIGFGDRGDHILTLAVRTASGAEYPIDYRVWAPLSVDELVTWLYDVFPHLSPPAKDSVGAYLLAAANAGRASVRGGKVPGALRRGWGPFTPPSHLVHANLWNRPEDVPADAFVELRVYYERWDVETRARDTAAVQLDLIYRFRS